jgi:hypothetical protein
MLQRHVSDQLPAYLDDAIADSERMRVEAHMNECEYCRQRFEEIRLGRAALARLPLVSAPDSIWKSIEASLVSSERPARNSWFPLRWVAAALMVAIAWGGWFVWMRQGEQPWQVVALEGSPMAGSRRISDDNKAITGDWVETDAQSRAQITIGAIGNVQVEPNTAVRLVSKDADNHRLALRSGEIVASISAPPRLFFVDTPAGTAIDLGCEYRLRCDRRGVGVLQVTSGWVALEWKGRESLVPAGAMCRMYEGLGPGTPSFEDASQAFLRAIESFDVNRLEGLPVILTEARARDTLTLWHLLSRVDGQHRAAIYDRMAQLAPPPAKVTRDAVLRLDAGSLKRWREELAWIW